MLLTGHYKFGILLSTKCKIQRCVSIIRHQQLPNYPRCGLQSWCVTALLLPFNTWDWTHVSAVVEQSVKDKDMHSIKHIEAFLDQHGQVGRSHMPYVWYDVV